MSANDSTQALLHKKLGEPAKPLQYAQPPMPLEFAIRQRIRIPEDVAPPRRSRMQLPSIALPIAMYWLALGALTYGFIAYVRYGDATALERESESEPELSLHATEDSLATSAPAANAAFEAQPNPQPNPEPRPEPEPNPEPQPNPEPERHSRADAPAALRTDEPSSSPPPSQESREAPPATSSLPSCEQVVASSNEQIDFAARRAPDLSRDAFASILENGAYLQPCSVPERTALEICVAVQEGRVKGVTVTAKPASATISACVTRAVSSLRFPHSSRLDITRTRFDATP